MAGNYRMAAAGLLLLAAGCATVDSPATTSEITAAGDAEKKYSQLELQRAKALRGDANDQFILAGMYERGQGAPQSYAEAAKWYRLAAEQGHAAAQFYLGSMYASARGVESDYAAAVMWYGKSAAQGYRDALYPMAYAHEYGIGGATIDYDAAVQWYLKSAQAGVWQAMDRLGKAYQNGELGLTPDAEMAKNWLAQGAAMRGNQQTLSVPVDR